MQMTKRPGFEFVLLAASFAVSLVVVLQYWGAPILDSYGFRQAQTALPAYYFIKEGVRPDYLTPVFGPPWSIPFEFPSYQSVVALLSMSTGLHIDQAGRAVGLLFFYASLPAVYMLMMFITKNRRSSLLVLCFILLSPVYLYYSRAVLIESTALCLSAWYLYLGVAGVLGGRPLRVALASAFGVLGSLTKITTFSVWGGAAFMFLALYFATEGRQRLKNSRSALALFAAALLLFALPVWAGFAWAGYANSIKALNPFGVFQTSTSLTEWNFGPVAQRLSPFTLKAVFKYAISGSSAFLLLAPVLAVASWRGRYFFHGLVSFAAYLSGPVIFTNLYFYHRYYFYANTVFLLVALGFWGVGIYDRHTRPARFLIPIVMVAAILTYHGAYYKKFLRDFELDPFIKGVMGISQSINELVPEDGVIVIYGNGWDCSIPYYSERKAIMVAPWAGLDIHQEAFRSLIERTGPEHISAMVVTENERSSGRFMKERIAFYGLDPSPVYTDGWFSLYVSPRLMPQSP